MGLCYRLYQPQQRADNLIVVYHGGGVNMDAGYDILARQLSTDGGIAVCLVDIRGHGRSAGDRGQVTHATLIWRDVDTLLSEMRSLLPQARIHLLGHSSGCGMLINYFTRYQPQQKADSLMLLAPEFGPFAAGVRRKVNTVPFANVRQMAVYYQCVNRRETVWRLSGGRAELSA